MSPNGNKNINRAPVHIIKDDRGLWEPITPPERMIDCSSTFIASELLRKTAEGDNCGSFEEGTVAALASTNTVATVKLKTEAYGFIWITAADYADFVDYCNDCCVS